MAWRLAASAPLTSLDLASVTSRPCFPLPHSCSLECRAATCGGVDVEPRRQAASQVRQAHRLHTLLAARRRPAGSESKGMRAQGSAVTGPVRACPGSRAGRGCVGIRGEPRACDSAEGAGRERHTRRGMGGGAVRWSRGPSIVAAAPYRRCRAASVGLARVTRDGRSRSARRDAMQGCRRRRENGVGAARATQVTAALARITSLRSLDLRWPRVANPGRLRTSMRTGPQAQAALAPAPLRCRGSCAFARARVQPEVWARPSRTVARGPGAALQRAVASRWRAGQRSGRGGGWLGPWRLGV